MRQYLIPIIVIVGLGLFMSIFTLAAFVPVSVKAAEYDESIANNVMKSTADDCPFLLLTKNMLDGNIFNQKTAPAVDMKIKEFGC